MAKSVGEYFGQGSTHHLVFVLGGLDENYLFGPRGPDTTGVDQLAQVPRTDYKYLYHSPKNINRGP